MTRRKTKNILVSVLMIVLALCLLLPITLKASAAPFDTATFKMRGASVKFQEAGEVVDKSGLRFEAQVSKADFDALTAVTKVGFKVAPSDKLTEELTFANADTDILDIDTTNGQFINETDLYVFKAYIYGIPKASYYRQIKAIFYITADGATKETAVISRSIGEVAERAVKDLKDVKDATYSNQIGSKFSPYTDAQRSGLYKYITKSYMDTDYNSRDNCIGVNLKAYNASTEKMADATVVNPSEVDVPELVLVPTFRLAWWDNAGLTWLPNLNAWKDKNGRGALVMSSNAGNGSQFVCVTIPLKTPVNVDDIGSITVNTYMVDQSSLVFGYVNGVADDGTIVSGGNGDDTGKLDSLITNGKDRQILFNFTDVHFSDSKPTEGGYVNKGKIKTIDSITIRVNTDSKSMWYYFDNITINPKTAI